MATPINLSVMKAFDTLELLSEDRFELTAEIVARELSLSYATAHRFLVTLEAAGVLTAVRRGAFAPGPRLARLGRMAEDLAPLPPGLQATLDGLRQELKESVMACRFTARGPFCVAVSAAQRSISVNIRTGTTLPMLNTAQGRLFLAAMSARDRKTWAIGQGVDPTVLRAVEPALEEVRGNGYAVNRGENEPDIAAVSVPVQIDGDVGLTISVFGMLSRFHPAFVDRAKSQLIQAAADLVAL